MSYQDFVLHAVIASFADPEYRGNDAIDDAIWTANKLVDLGFLPPKSPDLLRSRSGDSVQVKNKN